MALLSPSGSKINVELIFDHSRSSPTITLEDPLIVVRALGQKFWETRGGVKNVNSFQLVPTVVHLGFKRYWVALIEVLAKKKCFWNVSIFLKFHCEKA